ncbi:MAG: malQ, partial [Nevskia sp.]|nr:malQ [Nevskia sp.]
MSDQPLYDLAAGAGIATHWSDYRSQPQTVGADSLRRILSALDLRCDSEAQIADSLQRVAAERADPQLPPLITAIAGEPTLLPDRVGKRVRLRLEDGSERDLATLPADAARVFLPAIAEAGYHRLQLADREITLAVAPRRAFGIADLRGGTAPRRLWGLAAQLYSLRRAGDGGIGDFTALADLAQRAARSGADAVAVSPVHALFAADL